MKNIIKIVGLILVIFISTLKSSDNTSPKVDKPTLCFTFDDGSTQDYPGYTNEGWNSMILNSLRDNNLQAAFFVKGEGLDNPRGWQVIKKWDDAGHLICNHTYSHLYYNSAKISCGRYSQDFLKNDSLIKTFKNYTKLFRFPFLKEGNTIEKRDTFRKFLAENGYRNGYVTIDASDWYICDRLIKRLKENPKADINGYRDYYLKHLLDRAQYYNDLAIKLTGRNIKHSILLHHNLTSALFLKDLIVMFRKNGWEITNASDAYKDRIYFENPDILPAGESLIWALAKQSGKFESMLRYPGEDGDYEKATMDSLGL